VTTAYSAEPPMEPLPGVRLVPLSSRPHPARLAAEADYILLAAPLLDAAYLAQGLSRLRSRHALYPVEVSRAPTIYSILGIAGILLEEAEKGNNIVVVYTPPGILVAAAAEAVARGAEHALRRYKGLLTSPLHYRLLAALALLEKEGLDLRREAERNKPHAFAGGDAHRSDLVLNTGDLEHQLLGPRGCSLAAYTGAEPPSGCRDAIAVAEALDPRGEGAADVIALLRGDNTATAVIGCRLLLHPLGCTVEQQAVARPLARLLKLHGLRFHGVEEADPEEAACLAYPGYGCQA